MRRFSTVTSASLPPKVSTSGASSTTWWLVRTSPEAAMTNPLPDPISTFSRSIGRRQGPMNSTRRSPTTRMNAMASAGCGALASEADPATARRVRQARERARVRTRDHQS